MINNWVNSLVASFISTSVAELGDKTQLMVIALSAGGDKRLVFPGAMLALTLSTTLSVFFGNTLSTLIPTYLVNVFASLFFVVTGFYMIFKRGRREVSFRKGGNLFWTSFISVFLAELGDKTQLATIALAARYGVALPVFTGCTLGFVVLTLVGMALGEQLSKKLPEKALKVATGAIFIVVGLFLLFKG